MRRLLSIFSVALLIIATFIPVVPTVKAKDADVVYEDGTYDIPVTALHASKDEASITDDYIDSSSLTVEGEKLTIHLTFSGGEMIQDLQIKQNGEFVVADLTTEGEYKEGSFEVNNLNEILEGKIHVVVDLGGFGYDSVHDVRFEFDDSNIPLQQNNEPEQDNGEEIDYAVDVPMMEGFIESVKAKEVDGKQQITIRYNTQKFIEHFEVDVGNGLEDATRVAVDDEYVDYVFTVNAIDVEIPTSITIDANGREMVHDFNLLLGNPPAETPDNGEEIDYAVDVPRMEGFIESVKAKEVDGKQEITVRFNSGEMIPNFLVDVGNGLEDAKRVEVDGDLVDYVFEVDTLDVDLLTKVVVKAGEYSSEYEFTLTLGNPPAETPGNGDDDGEKDENTDENTDEDNNENNDEKDENSDDEDESTDPVKQKGKYLDGEYELPFTVLQDANDEESVMQDFVNSTGRVVIENGEATVYVTITADNFVTSFRTFYNGQFIDAEKEIIGDDEAEYRFQVENLDVLLNGEITLSVPGVYENETYGVRFQFDTSELPLNPDYDEDLDFDRDEDEDDEDKTNGKTDEKDTSGDNDQTTPTDSDNPKTGDKSNVLLFGSMFASSALLLGYQIYRRRIA